MFVEKISDYLFEADTFSTGGQVIPFGVEIKSIRAILSSGSVYWFFRKVC